MKKILVLILLAITTAGYSQTPDIKGKWQDDFGGGFELNFENDGKGTIISGGITFNMEYKINNKNTPAWIDIIFIKKDGTEGEHNYGVFSLADKNTMDLMMNKKERPKAVDQKGTDYLKLLRVK